MKLSIITINFNNAEGLKRTIESIIKHNHLDFEYIVIDGNSSDGSVDIIKEYTNQINYWISEPDSGIYNAMNKGILQAKGEYVLFINSGDIIQEHANIQYIIEQISGEDIIYFDLKICDNISNETFIKNYPDHPDFKYFIEDTLPHPASLIKKEVLIKYGLYSERMKIVSDWAFFMDAICLNKSSYKHIKGHFSSFFLDGISSDEKNRQLVLDERNAHIASSFKMYESLYNDWMNTKQELYKLKNSVSVRYLKKIGLLKWLKL